MMVMQKEDECHASTLSSDVLRQDSTSYTDTVLPCKRKTGSPLPKNAKRPNFGLNMLNGYRSNDRTEDACQDGLPVATLSNMGNTCYLNSVLYTLRFTPTFLHNLHHLAVDMASMHSRLNQTKAKSSSLGRNVSGLSGQSNRSSSSKDLPSLGSVSDLCPKSKMQITTEKLHELYMQLHNLEMRDSVDSCQPSGFLQALIDVNSLYHGNQQQDAHELLVNLLDILRETCDMLARQAENQPETLPDPVENETSNSIGKSWTARRSRKKGKEVAKKKNSKESEINGVSNESDEHSSVENVPVDKPKKAVGYNFVSEDFGGVSLLRMKCLECETVTERKEPFYDICVPIPPPEDEPIRHASDLYRAYCVTSENLRDANKYWCDHCVRYNEACSEVILYIQLYKIVLLNIFSRAIKIRNCLAQVLDKIKNPNSGYSILGYYTGYPR